MSGYKDEELGPFDAVQEFVDYTIRDGLNAEMNKAFDDQIEADCPSPDACQTSDDTWEQIRDSQLREKALEAALKTNNPSRADLLETAEALYAFLKGDAK